MGTCPSLGIELIRDCQRTDILIKVGSDYYPPAIADSSCSGPYDKDQIGALLLPWQVLPWKAGS